MEEDKLPKGQLAYDDFKGSLTRYVIESGKPLLATPELIDQLCESGDISFMGAVGTDWLGVPLINEGYVIGVMTVQSYSESTRYLEQDKELLNFAAQHIVAAMTRLQDHERLQMAVNSRTHELMLQIREREKAELLQESLYRIAELTSDDSLEIEQFYHQVHNIIGQLINASNFFIALYDQPKNLINLLIMSI